MSDETGARPINDEDLLATAIPIPHDEDDGSMEPEEVHARPAIDGVPVIPSSKIRRFDNSTAIAEHGWRRRPHKDGRGAVRMKTFVAKLRPEAIEHLDEQINQWLDAHDEFEVKLVSSSIGTLTGKSAEEALFVTVWV